MSGIIRNLLTLIQAIFSYGRFKPHSCVTSSFLVTPMDAGIRVLKSDKYLQFAEAAQLDFLVKTKLMGKMLRGGCQFVNASILVKFMKPIGVFRPVRVETRIVYADAKCAYFSHSLFMGNQQHGEVLIKMKFKKGSLTVCPAELIGECPTEKPPHIHSWDQAIAEWE
ncbi:MAG: hypothetical protein Q7T25_00535 [Sideroxyarcus sp.]|nr:hypothetical protein [Sideroxyarcus sp.]